MVGNVAIQQALVNHFGLSYRKAAFITKVNHRTVWQHVAARKGANVAAWDARSQEQRIAAISAAQKLIEKHNA